jgi:hypothetical protein
MEALVLMTWFVIKHFICDFPLQAFPWIYNNKGTLGHPGGLVHAGIHGIATFIILCFLAPPYAFLLAGFDMVVHYFIDWGKMNLNRITGWGLTTSEWFWSLLGFDQLLHYLTYILIIYVII